MIKNITILHTFLLLLIGAAGMLLPETLHAQTIGGSVYGGAQIATVGGNTSVTIYDGHFGADIFGGGKGELNNDKTVKASADIGGNTTVEIHGGEFSVAVNTDDATKDDKPFLQRYNIYAGGNLACKVGTSTDGETLKDATGDTHLKIMKGMLSNTSDGTENFLVSEEGALDLVYEREGKMYFCAFGGGFGKHTSVLGNSYVDFNIIDGKDIENVGLEDDMLPWQSLMDLVGGGFNGSVGGNTYVHVGGNAMCRNLYGGGLYATIGGTTAVDVTGGNIDNVYGGGVMGDILNTRNEENSTLVTIGLHKDRVIDELTFYKNNAKITILGSVYGGNDVSGHVGKATINHLGGKIQRNVYGAGNGNYQGYYTPNRCAFAEGENDNYYIVNHDDGEDATNGPTYKGRPQTDEVSITFDGLAENDKAVVLGQVFGGGNSCTVGMWDAELLESDKYHGNPHEVRDDPAYFLGGGRVSINVKSHVKIGRSNSELASLADAETLELYLDGGENVSGLFMGCSGKDLATQTTSPTDYTYHHYYDGKTKQYWQGFAVYKNEEGHYEELLDPETGRAAFNAYLNNIMIWSDYVTLNIDNDATDVWLANFVGGGFRGSMKAKTDGKKYMWTLPTGVTVGNNIVGGAYNTDVVYRIYKTTDGHTYTTNGGKYEYRTDTTNLTQGTDYDHVETDVDGNVTGIVRFMYAGGILSSDGSNKEDFVTLDLRNSMDGGENAQVYGGCFASGIIQGDTKIDYRATGAYDVYGGGALANVAGSTKVNLLGGTLTNAYGGGLGRAQDETHTAVAALVNGDATVVLDGAAAKNIFGCNNVNGTPKGQAMVHVKRTVAFAGSAHDDDDEAPKTYHVDAVYGGGNHAAYEPTDAADKSTKVIIEGCESSIENVYGGGNAAAVPGTDVTIYGGDINMAFGGGNGLGDGNPGADVGYLGYYSSGNQTTYGPGTAKLTIYGGTINDAFGGSNTLGYIRTSATVNIDEMPDAEKEQHTACPLLVGNVHGGGNNAPMFCNGVVNCNCIKGVDVIFAGSDNADIHGDIEMNITSGAYAKVFGGNNQGGNIEGSITINIDETGCWPVMIGELYGCGNDAPYSVYGYTNEGPRTKAQFDALTEEQKTTLGLPYSSPYINIISATKIGRIFGGGCGEAAKVYGDINVDINMIKGMYAGQTVGNGMMTIYKDGDDYKRRGANDEERRLPDAIGTIENVFGGGDAAEVIGNTTVNIGTKAKVKHLNDNETEGDTPGANITGDVFGGGNKGQVTGSANVNVGSPS